jgi:hypothetical protein
MHPRDQLPSPLHFEGKAPVLRVTPGQHVISGFPSKLTQLLLLTDLRAESRPAVEFAIELTRLFTARLTLMHRESLQSSPTFGREDLPTSPDSDPARPALLCLMWEVRQRGLDVGFVHRGCPRARADMADRGGAQRRAYRAAGKPFRLVPSNCEPSDTFEAVQGAPCPLLVVDDRTVPPVSI